MTQSSSSSTTFNTWVIYGLIVIYALCYQLQRPIEPFLVDKLVKGGTVEASAAYAQVTSFFSVMQGFGSLVMGSILDRYGVRVGLIVNFIACAMQYYLLSVSDSLPILFLSKVPGMLMGGFLCAQTAVATVTSDGPDRVRALGRLTTAYTIGSTSGLYLGGYFGVSGDYYYTARLATVGSIVACGLVLLLPDSLTAPALGDKDKDKDKDKDNKGKGKGEVESGPLSWIQRASHLLYITGSLLSVKVATGLANNMARSAQPLVLKNQLDFDENAMGKVMSAQQAFGGFANGFLLEPLTAALGGEVNSVVRNCIVVMGSIYAIQASLFNPSTSLLDLEQGATLSHGYLFVGLSLALSTFQYGLATGITAGTQAIVPKSMVGTLMGIEHSIFAVAGGVGPLIGTYIFSNYGISGLSLFCSSLFFLILFVWKPIAAKATISTKTAKNETKKYTREMENLKVANVRNEGGKTMASIRMRHPSSYT